MPRGTFWKLKSRLRYVLPPEVQEGLKKKAGKGTISKVESLTRKGTLVAYEAQVRNGSKRSEIQVGPDGKPLSHKE